MIVILRMAITNNIRTLRERAGLTQESIAERLKTTRSNYAYLENRGEKLTVEQLQGIADALEVSLADLIGIEGKDLGQTAKIEEQQKEIEDLKRINDGYKLLYTEHLNKLQMLYHSLVGHVQRNIIREAIDKGILTLERCEGWLIYETVHDSPYMIDFDVDSIEAKGLDPDDFFLSHILTENEISQCLKGQDWTTKHFLTTLALSLLIDDKHLKRAFWELNKRLEFPERYQDK